MKSRQQIVGVQSEFDRFSVFRRLLVILLSVSVIFGQTAPAYAGHGTNTSASWIEICGEGGSHFIQVDQNGQEVPADCEHCEFCIVPLSDFQSGNLTADVAQTAFDFSSQAFSIDQANLPVTYEKYWSSCRGPPINNAENNVTTTKSYASKGIAKSDVISWRNL